MYLSVVYLQCHIPNWANWQALLPQGTQRCRPLGPSTSAGSKQGEAGKSRDTLKAQKRRRCFGANPISANCMPLQPWASEWFTELHASIVKAMDYKGWCCIWYHFVSSFCIIFPRQELQDSESVGLRECIAEHTVTRASTASWGLSTLSLRVHHVWFRIYVVIDTNQ